MCHGFIPQTGEPQPFYSPPDHPSMPRWFKGMEWILRERSLWPEHGLPSECPGFKCPDGRSDCCCRCLLFNQPDFVTQQSHLKELIWQRDHLCDFYPKYHCKLNFIEQYWGAAKLRFHVAGHAKTFDKMEKRSLLASTMSPCSKLDGAFPSPLSYTKADFSHICQPCCSIRQRV